MPDRYAAYLAAVSQARSRFDRGGPAEKLAALREIADGNVTVS